jgi:hypothetical protein
VSDDLRKFAQQLRDEAARRVTEKRVKCAQILSAASALELLRRKLGGSDVG